MNNRAKYDREHSKTPKEFLKKSRLTTESIGGGVVYDSKGEFVEYDVALEALKMAREEQQEQPEVDLEKEIDKTISECTDGYNFDWDRFATHFYELGLKARKEE